ncbi:APC family permease [Paracoccus sp. PAR01]|uniref:APC family permease n=1 Tax=Paracoccus sp. PAR01 TaxID=2769282 RepID=UPI00177E544E|nr:APC family permease [Paracoccus sp. PAR01]MBD9527615.1 APC family permease [Paracoccus sp. PAR01]
MTAQDTLAGSRPAPAAPHELRRRLKVSHVVCLAMADASPAMAVLLLSGGVFQVGGTFAAGAMLILSVVVILIAMCLGELASTYPSTGGSYSMVRSVLPEPLAWITLFNFVTQGIVIPASLLLGIPIFLKHLMPGLTVPNEVIAFALLVISGGIAITKVEIGARVNIAILIVQLVVVGLIVLAAVIAPAQNPVDIVLHPVAISDGQLVAVTIGMALATLAPAFNVLNGYDAVCGFVEELVGGAADIGRSVIYAAILASVLITVPLIAGVIAAPDLTAFLQSDAPIVYAVESALGPWASTILDIGVIAALFNAALTLQMYFARGVFASARDGLWPQAVNARLAQLNRFSSPGWAVAALLVPSVFLIGMSSLDWLIMFAGTMIATVYFFVAVAALFSRIAHPAIKRPFRMPFWPLAPLIVIAFTGYALLTQTRDFLIGELVLAGIALLAWALSKLWRRAG